MNDPLTITPNPMNPVPTERYLRLLIVLAIILSLLGLGYIALRLLYSIRHTALLFSLGLLAAYVLDPVVEMVRGNIPSPLARIRGEAEPLSKKRPRWLGIVVVFALLFVLIGTGLFLLGKEGMHQAEMFARDRPHIEEQARQRLAEYDEELRRRGIPLNLTETINRPPPAARQWFEGIGRDSLTVASVVSRGAAEGFIVLLIAIYFLLFREQINAAALRAVSDPLRPYVQTWQDDLDRILGGFVRGQATLALFIGVAAGVLCGLLGLRFWLLLGLFAAFASLIPVIGSFLGAIPAVLSALLSPRAHFGPVADAVIVIVLFTILNEIGSKVLYPKLVGRALGLHEVAVLFALLAGLELGGLVGVLFAAPITALALAAGQLIWRIWRNEPPHPLAATAVETAESAGEM